MGRPIQAALFLLLALMVPAVNPAQESVEVPFELHNSRRAILLRAQINGKPATLILDTGAAHTVLSPELAGVQEIDLKLARVSGDGPGMRGEALWGEANLRLGDTVWLQRRVVAMNLREISRIYGQPIHGLLGQDVLTEFRRVIVDFHEKKIILQR